MSCFVNHTHLKMVATTVYCDQSWCHVCDNVRNVDTVGFTVSVGAPWRPRDHRPGTTPGRWKFCGRSRDGDRGRRTLLVVSAVWGCRPACQLHTVDNWVMGCGARGRHSRRAVRPNAARPTVKFSYTTGSALAAATGSRQISGAYRPRTWRILHVHIATIDGHHVGVSYRIADIVVVCNVTAVPRRHINCVSLLPLYIL